MKTGQIIVVGLIGAGIAYVAWRSGYIGNCFKPTGVKAPDTVQQPSNVVGGKALANIFEDKPYRLSETRSGIITAQEQVGIRPIPEIMVRKMETVGIVRPISTAPRPVDRQQVISTSQPSGVVQYDPIRQMVSADYFRKRPTTLVPPPIAEG